MTKDELIAKVAEKLVTAEVDCPGTLIKGERIGIFTWHCPGGKSADCSTCWATAIVNLVKGEEGE